MKRSSGILFFKRDNDSIKVYETFDRINPEIINIEISNLRNKSGK